MYTKSDIMQMVEEEDVEFIRKMLPSPAVSWKKRWITVVCLTVLQLKDL